MASYKSLVIILMVATLAVALPTITMATEYVVGDTLGWTLDYDYQTWAKDKVFKVGDTLVFNYTQGKHNVAKVDGNGFQNCTAPPGQELTSGHDVVNLTASGKKWYICSVSDHCTAHGMKLVINVEGVPLAPPPAPGSGGALAPPPAPSSAPAISTSGYTIFAAAAAAVLTLAASMVNMA